MVKQGIAGILGPILLGYGSGISLSAGFGPFGFTVLLDGFHEAMNIPFWITQTVMSIVCFWIAWVWGKIPLGVGTISTLLLIGPAISIGAAMTPENLPLSGNIIAFVVGLTVSSFGVALAAAANMGPDAITALSLAAEKMKSWSIPSTMLLWTAIAITFGFLLGGTVGAATIIGLVAQPLLINYFLPPLRSMIPSKPSLK